MRPFAARPDKHETKALLATESWQKLSGGLLTGGHALPAPITRPLARPLPLLLCSPPSPPATSAAITVTCHVQGPLTFGKPKDKAWAPHPGPPPAPQPHNPAGGGPRRRPISRSPSSLLHSLAQSRGLLGQARPAKSQRLYCIYSRQSRKKFRFFHPDKVLWIICKKSGKFQKSVFRRRPLGWPSLCE